MSGLKINCSLSPSYSIYIRAENKLQSVSKLFNIYQGWKQTSVSLQVIQYISGLKTNFSLSPSYSIYIKAENKLQSVSKLLRRRVIGPQKSPVVEQQLSVKIIHKETNTTWHTSYIIEHTTLPLGKSKPYPRFQNAYPEKQFNTCFGVYLYFACTQHGNLLQPSGTTSRVTYFILQSHTRTQETLRRGFGKMQVNGPGE